MPEPDRPVDPESRVVGTTMGEGFAHACQRLRIHRLPIEMPNPNDSTHDDYRSASESVGFSRALEASIAVSTPRPNATARLNQNGRARMP